MPRPRSRRLAVEIGVVVSRPVQDAPYDLVLDLQDRLMRVQCKWAILTGDVVTIRCRRCRRGPEGFIHRGYGHGEIDAIAAYCLELDACYLLPLELSIERAAVSLRLAPPQNNQKRKIHWAEEYEFAATLSCSRAHSSAGRALAWHARGRRFEPDWVHRSASCQVTAIRPPRRRNSTPHGSAE